MSKVKFNFGVMSTMVLGLLGLSEFKKDKDNKIELTADEQQKIIASYGKDFLEKLTAQLNSDKEVSAEIETELYDAMKAHLTEELNNQLETKINEAAAEKAALEAKITALNKNAEEIAKQLAILAAQEIQLPNAGSEEVFFGKREAYKKGDTIMKVNQNASHYAAINRAAQNGFPVLASGTSIDVDDVRNEFGKYLGQNGQQIRIDIYNQILNGFSSAEEFTVVLAANEYRAAQALITSVMQQFKPKWTPLGGFKFKPIMIKNRRHKINVPIVPADVLDSYLAFLYEQGLAPDQMPIVKYLIDSKIIPGLEWDIEMRAAFKGAFVEVEYDSAGKVIAGGTPETSMDGLETILVAHKTDAESGINYYPEAKTLAELKALTAQEMVDYIDNFESFISESLDVEKIYCSSEVWKLYKRANKLVWAQNSGVDNPNFGANSTLDFSSKVLKPLKGLYGSPILFATPKQNLVKLRWKKELPFVINDIQKHDYEVRIYGEFSFAVGFAIGDAVFAAVPDGYSPNQALTASVGSAKDYQKGIKPRQNALVTLKSAAATAAQSVAENETVQPIIYAFKGNASIVWTGTEDANTSPAGITTVVTDGIITITGTPTDEGNYGYTVNVAGFGGGNSVTANGTLTVTTGA